MSPRVLFWAVAFHSVYNTTKLYYPESQPGSSPLWRRHTHLCFFDHTRYLSLPKPAQGLSPSKLKLYPNKTEFIIIGTSTQRAKLDSFFPTHILSQNITPAASVLYLGVTFHENFNFKQHISKTCRCCFYHIRNLRRIRRLISRFVAKTIATALVTSIRDYGYSLLYNTANNHIAKLQRVQFF